MHGYSDAAKLKKPCRPNSIWRALDLLFLVFHGGLIPFHVQQMYIYGHFRAYIQFVHIHLQYRLVYDPTPICADRSNADWDLFDLISALMQLLWLSLQAGGSISWEPTTSLQPILKDSIPFPKMQVSMDFTAVQVQQTARNRAKAVEKVLVRQVTLNILILYTLINIFWNPSAVKLYEQSQWSFIRGSWFFRLLNRMSGIPLAFYDCSELSQSLKHSWVSCLGIEECNNWMHPVYLHDATIHWNALLANSLSTIITIRQKS